MPEIVGVVATSFDDRDDRYYQVRLLRPALIGDRTHSAGALVRVPERVARDLCTSGAGEAHGLSAAVAKFFSALCGDPTPAVRPAPRDERCVGDPNVRVLSGSLLHNGRSYTKEDGDWYFSGDVLPLLALADPEPGSRTAEAAARGARNLPVIQPVRPLGADELRRLAALRRDLSASCA